MTIAFDPKGWKDLPTFALHDWWDIKQSGEHVPFHVDYERLEGGFVPDIPYALIRRFTKPGWVVYDPMAGAMVTHRVATFMSRKCISVDLTMRGNLDDEMYDDLILADARYYEPEEPVDMIVWHPPYQQVVQFSDSENDLSNMEPGEFWESVEDCLKTFDGILNSQRICAIVIGNIYRDQAVVPLPALMHLTVEKVAPWWKLKGWITKNIVGNRQGDHGLWEYRSVNADSFVFGHEEILVYKKE